MTFDPQWLCAQDADASFDALHQAFAWEQLSIHAGHKDVLQPRLMAWAGDITYRYSGLTLEPRPVPDALAGLLARVRQECDVAFNHVVLNWYRDGRDNVGMHSDNEEELGPNPLIASLSLGAGRTFHVRHKRKRRLREQLELTHGSMLIMGGSMQHKWRHGVPREAAVTQPRLNVTFRLVRGEPGWRHWEEASQGPRP